jgi:hypothetical protein
MTSAGGTISAGLEALLTALDAGRIAHHHTNERASNGYQHFV